MRAVQKGIDAIGRANCEQGNASDTRDQQRAIPPRWRSRRFSRRGAPGLRGAARGSEALRNRASACARRYAALQIRGCFACAFQPMQIFVNAQLYAAL